MDRTRYVARILADNAPKVKIWRINTTTYCVLHINCPAIYSVIVHKSEQVRYRPGRYSPRFFFNYFEIVAAQFIKYR
jgi:hypothetical protein